MITFSHISALIAPSSGRIFLYAQNYCCIAWIHRFAIFLYSYLKNYLSFKHFKIVLNYFVCRSGCCYFCRCCGNIVYLPRSNFVRSAGYKEFAKASCLIEMLVLLCVGARHVTLVIMLFREPPHPLPRDLADSSGVSPENMSISQHALQSNALCMSFW